LNIFFCLQSFADTTAEAVMRRNFRAMKFESRIVNGGNYMIPIRIDSIGECSGCSEPNFKYRKADNDGITSMVKGEISGSLIKANESFFSSESDSRKLEGLDRFVGHNAFANLATPTSVQDQSLCNDGDVAGIGSENKMDCFNSFGNEYPEQNITPTVDGENICGNNTCKDSLREYNEINKEERGPEEGLVNYDNDREMEYFAQRVNYVACGEDPTEVLELEKGIIRESIEKNKEERGSKEGMTNSDKNKEMEDVAQRVNPVVRGEEPTKVLELKKGMHILDLDKNKTVRNTVTQSEETLLHHMVTRSTSKVAQSSSNPKQLLKSSRILKEGQKIDLPSKTQIPTESLACNKFDNVPKKIDQGNDQNIIEGDAGKDQNVLTRSTNKVAQPSSNPKQLMKSSRMLKGGQKNDLHSKTQILTESLACNKSDNVPKKIDQGHDQSIISKNKLKQSRKENAAEDNFMTSKVSSFC